MVHQGTNRGPFLHPLDPSLELVLLGTSDGSFFVSVADQDGSEEDVARFGSYSDESSSSSSVSLSSSGQFACIDIEAEDISLSSHDTSIVFPILSSSPPPLNSQGKRSSTEKENLPSNNKELKGKKERLKDQRKCPVSEKRYYATSLEEVATKKCADARYSVPLDLKRKRIFNRRNQSPASSSSSCDAISLADLSMNEDDDATGPSVLDLSTTRILQRRPKKSPSSFSCSCNSISLADSVKIEDDSDDCAPVTTSADVAVVDVLERESGIAYMFGDMKFSNAFSCWAVDDDISNASVRQLASMQRTDVHSAMTWDRVTDTAPINLTCKLPQEHGPIRRQLISDDDSSLSSNKSEAMTDHVSNVSFAKLASTIITSQALKKAVEPLDSIAAILESKGVGRGTHFIREIQESTELRLFIDDYSDANYWPLLDSLYFNKGLHKLVLFRNRSGDQARVRTHQEIECLFRVLNRGSSKLSELHLWNFAPEDQPQLSRGLAYNPSLEYIQIHLEIGSISSSLAKSLSTLPNLTSLELEVSSNFPVSSLLNSKSLGVLTVICCENPFEFDSNEIMQLAKKLNDNRVLSVLHLEPFISVDLALPAILESLKTTNRTLESFQFSCAASTVQEGDSALEHILDTLCVNSHLRVIWNNHHHSWAVSSKMRQKVFQVLEKNNTIQQFHVFPEAADYSSKKTKLLQNNMSVHKK